jgi:hypothetical protein
MLNLAQTFEFKRTPLRLGNRRSDFVFRLRRILRTNGERYTGTDFFLFLTRSRGIVQTSPLISLQRIPKTSPVLFPVKSNIFNKSGADVLLLSVKYFQKSRISSQDILSRLYRMVFQASGLLLGFYRYESGWLTLQMSKAALFHYTVCHVCPE